MSAMHRGAFLVKASHRSGASSHVCTRCAARYYHQQRSLQQKDDGATSNTAPPRAKPATRRQGAKVASRIIQGLRGAAPGGFGTKHGSSATSPSPQQVPAQDRTSKQPRRQSPKQPEGVNSNGKPGNHERQVVMLKDDLVARLQDDAISTADLKELQKYIDVPLARRFLKGKLVRFVDKEQKQRVLKLAQEQASKHADGKADVKFVSLSKDNVEQLNKKAVAGNYEAIHGVLGKTPQEQVMTQIKTAMQLNGSYSSPQREALLGFMVKMWPAQKQARNARA